MSVLKFLQNFCILYFYTTRRLKWYPIYGYLLTIKKVAHIIQRHVNHSIGPKTFKLENMTFLSDVMAYVYFIIFNSILMNYQVQYQNLFLDVGKTNSCIHTVFIMAVNEMENISSYATKKSLRNVPFGCYDKK